MRIKLLVLFLFMQVSGLAYGAERVSNIIPDSVVVGNSSNFTNGTWLLMKGEYGLPGCFDSSKNVSLFYTLPDGELSSSRTLSVLMTAKTTSSPITIEYTVRTGSTELYGYGVSSCRLYRISLD